MFESFTAVLLILAASVMNHVWLIILLPFILLEFLTIEKISDIRLKRLKKHIKYSTIRNNNDPEEFVFGKWYIGYLTVKHDKYDIDKLTLITTKAQYLKLKEIMDSTNDENDIVNTKKECKIAYYVNTSASMWNIDYSKRDLIITKTPTDKQQIIIEKITDHYKTNNREKTVVLLTGDPGTGKSRLVLFLANHLKTEFGDVALVRDYNPILPGDKFISIYSTIEPTNDKPLVVVIDEIDIILQHVHNDTVTKHKYYLSDITNKNSWNKYFDDLDIGIYKHIIFILTTNKNVFFFTELDKSYIRDGRIDLKIEM